MHTSYCHRLRVIEIITSLIIGAVMFTSIRSNHLLVRLRRHRLLQLLLLHKRPRTSKRTNMKRRSRHHHRNLKKSVRVTTGFESPSGYPFNGSRANYKNRSAFESVIQTII